MMSFVTLRPPRLAPSARGGPPKISRRLHLAAARRLAGDTLTQIAADFGVTPSAISKRLKDFERKLTPDQLRRFQKTCRHRYGKALATNGRRVPLTDLKV
jgi:hypothetical protein